MRDPFPARSRKNSRHSRHLSRGGALHRKGERNSRVVPPFQESPRCLSPLEEPFFPSQPRLSRRGSIHTTVARGTALWESLVGKTRGKASRESLVGKPRGKTRNPLINPTGKLTVLLMLGRKAHAHAPIGDEDDYPVETPVVPQDPCQHWRGNLRFGHRFQTRS